MVRRHSADASARDAGTNPSEQQHRKIKKLTAEKLKDEVGPTVAEAKDISLKGRGIETIVAFGRLPNLRKLDLSGNKLTRIQDVRSCPHLTLLSLAENQLTGEGLQEVRVARELVTLNVSHNKIARIPSQTLQDLHRLKALIMNNNAIHSMDWIPKLKELNTLVLSHNKIGVLDLKALQRLPSLVKLSLSNNELKAVPSLDLLPNLQELRLNHNKIETIAGAFRENTKLKIIEIGHNLIDNWEGVDELAELPELRQLSLKGNPICGVSIEESRATAEGDGVKREQSVTSDGEDVPDGEKREKKHSKEARRLDAKHKQYNFKMKRLFPKLIVRDGTRVMEKRSHTFKASKASDEEGQTEKANEGKQRGKKEPFKPKDVQRRQDRNLGSPSKTVDKSLRKESRSQGRINPKERGSGHNQQPRDVSKEDDKRKEKSRPAKVADSSQGHKLGKQRDSKNSKRDSENTASAVPSSNPRNGGKEAQKSRPDNDAQVESERIKHTNEEQSKKVSGQSKKGKSAQQAVSKGPSDVRDHNLSDLDLDLETLPLGAALVKSGKPAEEPKAKAKGSKKAVADNKGTKRKAAEERPAQSGVVKVVIKKRKKRNSTAPFDPKNPLLTAEEDSFGGAVGDRASAWD